ncbi:transcription initiation factor IIB [Haloarchaeobius amylolyticus]|uniref:transcription initiation factor IIB n=1 Tax=Haloarchaeobius amylolyticus TaxID=1198296 RepID=UPI0022704401|nr:transcription initiation factor IIB [Haloarchaeobius amylolyticus]
MNGANQTVKTADGRPTTYQSGGTRTETDESTADEREEATCPECGADSITDEEHGETVCNECGLVLAEDNVDRGPEWRAFDKAEKDKKSRVGAPTTGLLHDKGLSSVIDWQNKDAYGSQLSARKRQKMQRLRTWDERFRATSARDRNLKQALGEITRMASALDLPDNVQETASVIYRRALEEDLLPGRSIEAMATASLYAAARQSNVPRSLDEFAPVSRVDRREFARAYRYIGRELGLAVEPADPAEYLPRFCSELEVSHEVKTLAHELIESGKRQSVHSGKSPVGLAAAAIYAASLLANEKLTQKEVGEAAEVSEVTIRNRYKELLRANEESPSQATA